MGRAGTSPGSEDSEVNSVAGEQQQYLHETLLHLCRHVGEVGDGSIEGRKRTLAQCRPTQQQSRHCRQVGKSHGPHEGLGWRETVGTEQDIVANEAAAAAAAAALA